MDTNLKRSFCRFNTGQASPSFDAETKKSKSFKDPSVRLSTLRTEHRVSQSRWYRYVSLHRVTIMWLSNAVKIRGSIILKMLTLRKELEFLLVCYTIVPVYCKSTTDVKTLLYWVVWVWRRGRVKSGNFRVA